MTLHIDERNLFLKREVHKVAQKGKILLIVEGIDDLKFYTDILSIKELSSKTKVKYVEQIAGVGGCNEVLKLYENNKTELEQTGFIDNFYCILDKDYDFQQNRMSISNSNVLVLKYYSYESHLISEESLESLIKHFYRAPSSMYKNEITDYIFSRINHNILDKCTYLTAYALIKWTGEGKYIFKEEPFSDINNSKKLDHLFESQIKLCLDDLEIYLDKIGVHTESEKFEFVKKYYRGKDLLLLYSNLIGIIIKDIKYECTTRLIGFECPNHKPPINNNTKCSACIWTERVGGTINASNILLQLKNIDKINNDYKYIADFLEDAIRRIC